MSKYKLNKGHNASPIGWSVVDFSGIRNPPTWIAVCVYFFSIILSIISFIIFFSLIVQLLDAAFNRQSSDSHEVIRNLLLGVAALIGAPFLIWRTIIAQQQTNIARETHFTDLFTRSVEQLGADKELKELYPDKSTSTVTISNIEVRLGALYALERIAVDSERDHWPIMEVLTSYIQNNGEIFTNVDIVKEFGFIETNNIFPSDEYEIEVPHLISISNNAAIIAFQWSHKIDKLRADTATALKILGRRPFDRITQEKAQNLRLDLRGANLKKCELEKGNLSNANLFGSRLDGARLTEANLRNARLSNASLIGAHLKNARLDKTLISSCNLVYANLSRASLRGASLMHSKLYNADLEMSNCAESDFSFSIAVGATLKKAVLSGAKFIWARLDAVDFSKADLTGSDLSRASLQCANLSDATLAAKMTHVQLDDAILYGSDLSKTEGLTQEQVDSAFEGDASTQLPKGIVAPSSWPDSVLDDDMRAERLRDHPISKWSSPF